MKFGKFVVKFHIPILIAALVLLIPSVIGMQATRINYDMLNYLPDGMDTVTGQDLLLEDFGKGAFSFIIVENMQGKDVISLKEKIAAVPHVETVLWYDSFSDLSIPMHMLPQKIYDAFNAGDSTMLAVFFDTSTSSDDTMDTIREIRSLTGEHCFVSGMSALVTDLKDLCEKEEPIYVGLAVIMACAAMVLFLDNWIIPLIFLASIGMAILLNMGTNYFLGEISYLTKALSAVLQLAVTMDYSIFLWHSYNEHKESHADKKEAMAEAVNATLSSVVGSSVTTVAGFIALCFMSFTLGKDLGIVMAKGVLLGVVGCVTTLPSLILVFDRVLQKTKHRSLIPDATKLARGVTKHFAWPLVIFAVLLVPALFGYRKTNEAVYYDLGASLPDYIPYILANDRLQENFTVGSTHMVLTDSSMTVKETQDMIHEMEEIPGVKYVLGTDAVLGPRIPRHMLPDKLMETLESEHWKLLLINSEYKTASDEVNAQLDAITGVLKQYDPTGMLIGEAPCTKDMIEVTDEDFRVVNTVSIAAIFIIIALVTKSFSLPFILVAVIEFAIFINLGLPYYTNTSLPFIAPICISTIQLGATVDYAILMTTRYKLERSNGQSKTDAVTIALATSIPSVIVSALGLFAATFGVAIYSDIDIISSLCNLMARGAIVSMFCVIFILPSLFMLLDGLIIHTSIGFRPASATKKEAAQPDGEQPVEGIPVTMTKAHHL